MPAWTNPRILFGDWVADDVRPGLKSAPVAMHVSGTRLAYGYRQLHIVELPSGKAVATHAFPYGAAAIAFDGDALVLVAAEPAPRGYKRGDVWRWSVDKDRMQRIAKAGGVGSNASLSPRGRFAVFVEHESNQTILIDTQTGERTKVPVRHRTTVRCTAVSDSGHIATATPKTLYVLQKGEKKRQSFRVPEKSVNQGIAISEDGTRVAASVSNFLCVWNVDSRECMRIPWARWPRFTPSGELLALHHHRGVMNVDADSVLTPSVWVGEFDVSAKLDIACSGDRSRRVWSPSKRRGHIAEVYGAVPVGRRTLSVDVAGETIVWSSDDNVELRAAYPGFHKAACATDDYGVICGSAGVVKTDLSTLEIDWCASIGNVPDVCICGEQIAALVVEDDQASLTLLAVNNGEAQSEVPVPDWLSHPWMVTMDVHGRVVVSAAAGVVGFDAHTWAPVVEKRVAPGETLVSTAPDGRVLLRSPDGVSIRHIERPDVVQVETTDDWPEHLVLLPTGCVGSLNDYWRPQGVAWTEEGLASEPFPWPLPDNAGFLSEPGALFVTASDGSLLRYDSD